MKPKEILTAIAAGKRMQAKNTAAPDPKWEDVPLETDANADAALGMLGDSMIHWRIAPDMAVGFIPVVRYAIPNIGPNGQPTPNPWFWGSPSPVLEKAKANYDPAQQKRFVVKGWYKLVLDPDTGEATIEEVRK